MKCDECNSTNVSYSVMTDMWKCRDCKHKFLDEDVEKKKVYLSESSPFLILITFALLIPGFNILAMYLLN